MSLRRLGSYQKPHQSRDRNENKKYWRDVKKSGKSRSYDGVICASEKKESSRGNALVIQSRVTDGFTRLIQPSLTDEMLLVLLLRDTAHVLYPGVVDMDQLESDLTQFLIERSNNVDPSTTLLNRRMCTARHCIGSAFCSRALHRVVNVQSSHEKNAS